jgi:ATPase subunit of ABC transporter with duplicated ATPase domains
MSTEQEHSDGGEDNKVVVAEALNFTHGDGIPESKTALSRNNQHLIMLTGKIGSGKTTAAQLLVDHAGYTEVTFAGPIKEFARSIGFTWEEVYGTQAQKETPNKHYGISGRQFLQKFGTDLCR